MSVRGVVKAKASHCEVVGVAVEAITGLRQRCAIKSAVNIDICDCAR